MSDGRVGIVLVSHSAALAEGAAELAAQVSGGAVIVVAAGGTDDGRLGTSLAKLDEAVRRASSGAGVLVVPDLGSSVLTTLAYLDALGEQGGGPGEPILIADAPFVEGAVAATVTAAGGADVKAVRTAAEEARHARKL